MGRPEHYSRDIAQRCRSLISELRPMVQRGFRDDEQFGGPLGTTFLLAMATPMVVLPVERIVNPAKLNAAQTGDDRHLDPGLTQEVLRVFGPACMFGNAPFVKPGRWSYVAEYPRFNVAEDWPLDVLDALSTLEARERADHAMACHVLRDLRHALAHGGIAYLDEDGRQARGPAAMLAFANTPKNKVFPALNILRVSENDSCDFLMAWADWLGQPRLRDALDRLDPLANTG